MFKETSTRSIVKGISWRIVETMTTIIIVYVFFGRLDLAIAAGLLEMLLKVGLYWRRKRIEPFNLWFTGLPLSGKTTITDKVYAELGKLHIPLERIGSKDIRELIPGIGFSRKERNRHMHRIGNLIRTLQKNSISTVASFISPYRESPKAIREMVKNNMIVYVKADIETCKARDYKELYAKAMAGELQNFSDINDVYEEPQHTEIVMDTDRISANEAVQIIIQYVKRHYVK